MTDRERLIAILSKPIYPREGVDKAEAVADYLLDQGVRPVGNGRWEMIEKLVPVVDPDSDSMDAEYYKKHKFQHCSECKKELLADHYGYLAYDYCPHCGAKMEQKWMR